MRRPLDKWYSLPELELLAGRAAALEGELALARLKRLRAYLNADDGGVVVRLQFRHLPNVCVILDIHCEARLELVCQRCLEPVPHEVEVDVSYALLEKDAEGIGLPSEVETFILDGERFNPVQLIEDELIVSLPLVSTHASRSECGGLAHELDRINRGATSDSEMGTGDGGPRSSVASANH